MARKPQKSAKVGTKKRDGLSPAQERGAILLAGGKTITGTAEDLGLDRDAIHKWLRQPVFRERFDALRDEVTRQAKDHIQASLLRAAEAASAGLEAMKPLYLKDGDGFAPVEDVPDHNVRLRAAFDILDRAGIPRKVEAVGDDPQKALAAALAVALNDRT